MRHDVVPVIPAYNAAATVGPVVAASRAALGNVLVVDDGSTDATADVAAQAGAEVVRHSVNQGKGAAILTALRRLAARGTTHALTLDADGQHFPEEMQVLLAASAAAPDAIVVGVRRKEGHPIAAINRLGNRVADGLMRAIAGQPLPDTQSGFRIYPVQATLGLGAGGTRYEFETEILLRAARRGVPIVGVPVRVHYPPVAERVSHYRPWRDTARIVGTVVRVLYAG